MEAEPAAVFAEECEQPGARTARAALTANSPALHIVGSSLNLKVDMNSTRFRKANSIMSTVNASVWLPTPIDRVREYIAEGFTKASTAPHRARIVAHIPHTGVLLSKNVELTCEPKGDDSGDWIIRWKPEPGGTYPSFEGVLSVSQRKEKTILTLVGSYTPPLGRAGEAFDRIAGHTISDDAAHGVLMNIAADMRARYAFEEAIKEYAPRDETASEEIVTR